MKLLLRFFAGVVLGPREVLFRKAMSDLVHANSNLRMHCQREMESVAVL
jgi:hypothetical protein